MSIRIKIFNFEQKVEKTVFFIKIYIKILLKHYFFNKSKCVIKKDIDSIFKKEIFMLIRSQDIREKLD